jgi:hypothetical protein
MHFFLVDENGRIQGSGHSINDDKPFNFTESMSLTILDVPLDADPHALYSIEGNLHPKEEMNFSVQGSQVIGLPVACLVAITGTEEITVNMTAGDSMLPMNRAGIYKMVFHPHSPKYYEATVDLEVGVAEPAS